jgi:hypothetical protein
VSRLGVKLSDLDPMELIKERYDAGCRAIELELRQHQTPWLDRQLVTPRSFLGLSALILDSPRVTRALACEQVSATQKNDLLRYACALPPSNLYWPLGAISFLGALYQRYQLICALLHVKASPNIRGRVSRGIYREHQYITASPLEAFLFSIYDPTLMSTQDFCFDIAIGLNLRIIAAFQRYRTDFLSPVTVTFLVCDDNGGSFSYACISLMTPTRPSGTANLRAMSGSGPTF